MYSIIQIIYTSMSIVTASHSTTIYSISVPKALYGCTSSDKEIPPGTLRFSFYQLELKLKEKKKIPEIII